MADQKISQLATIVTVDNASDLFPIVDTSAAETKKITPSALKTALALNNVDNTSDLNKPISTLTQGALDNKQATLISGSNIKTINSTTILGGGDLQVAPASGIDATAIATGVVSNTEFETLNGVTSAIQVQLDAKQATITGGATTIASTDLTVSKALVSNEVGKVAVATTTSTELGYLNGVTSAIQTQLDAKQATLVSGTNIKTINSTSILGSGDIVINASPSGVAGAIQFSNGSAFASDAANLFWDDTNNRLGVGTTTPTQSIETPNAIVFASANNDSKTTLKALDGSTGNIDFGNEFVISRQGIIVYKMFFNNSTAIYGGGSPALRVSATQQVGIGTQGPTARLTVQGSGSTSATTSLLVQNSAGNNALQVRDDRVIIMAGLPTSSSGLPTGALWNNLGILSVA
jgi:hypothetical protein